MNSELVYDAVVIGAGGAGMNLLLAMHHQGYLDNHRVVVIEPFKNVTNNRTWCFWAHPDELIVQKLGHLIPNVWDFSESEGRRNKLAPFRYYHLRGIDFYNHVYACIDSHPNVLWLNDAVNEVSSDSSYARVSCQEQGMIVGRYVFDSRISTTLGDLTDKKNSMVWQSFFGYRIQISSARFTPEVVKLMDFNIDQSDQCQFVYLLPFSENQALVELTRFGTECLNSVDDNYLLHQWVMEHYGEFEILEREEGKIPMTLQFNPQQKHYANDERVIAIGTAAGNVKSTTGYAFHAMFDHSQAIVSKLNEGKSIPTAYHKKRFSFYDSLLLDILENKPQLGKPIFNCLFKKRSTSEVLSFLREETKLSQEIPILLSLPKEPFLKALYQCVWKSESNEPSIKPSYQLEFNAFLFTVVLLTIQLLNPLTLAQFSPVLLLIGMVFPGIPHGAVDHKIRLGEVTDMKKFFAFISLYILAMLFVFSIWMLSSGLALIIFILYSAWHFGETDFQRYGAKASVGSFISGISLLTFILLSHNAEFGNYLLFFKAEGLLITEAVAQIAASLAFVVFFINGWYHLNSTQRMGLFFMGLMLILTVKLPLLIAFGVYFIGIHSISGWNDIQKGMKLRHNELLKSSVPFSLGAILSLLGFTFLVMKFEWNLAQIVPALFIGLSCLSAPHVFVMSGFYKRLEKG